MDNLKQVRNRIKKKKNQECCTNLGELPEEQQHNNNRLDTYFLFLYVGIKCISQ